MKVRWLFGALAALSALPHLSAAQAQSGMGVTSETGTLITRRPAEIHGESTVAARTTLRQFGECSLRRRPLLAERVIDMPVDSPEQNRLLRRLASEDCLASGELSISFRLLRGALFEAMYLKAFGRDTKPEFKGLPPFDYVRGYSLPLSPQAQQTVALAVTADCVVRTAPVGARELITSVPGSDLEDKAVFVVSRNLPGCIPPAQTIKFSRAVIRSSIAEALYRLSTSRQEAEAVK